MNESLSDDAIGDLIERCRAGDQQAATLLFRRHLDRLMALVGSRLSSKMNSRFDPEDVVQSAYRSFFRGVGDGRYAVERSSDLWSLLAAITMHKFHRRVAFHTAKKRTVLQEQPPQHDSLLGVQPEIVAQAPTPAEAAVLVEELEQVMSRLSTLERDILELRLEGYSVEEIAVRVKRSDRTVRRLLAKLQSDLEARLVESRSA
jgi:RNA polymerase sigma-70 factor (ECF subfamily)